jgi:ligand-binding SRPBCC domain-containing protein
VGSNRIRFVKAIQLPAAADEVFAWHEAPGAFARLTPPREPVRVLRHEGGIKDGARVLLRVGPWPFSLRWELEHRDYREGRSFTDAQVRGPFRYWQHVHRMIPQGPDACLLEDSIEYEMPLGILGRLVARLVMQPKLERLFAFRHEVTRRAFERPMP